MIGILTYNRAINYGAVLQSFALKEFLSRYDNCDIINYKNAHIEKVYTYQNENLLKKTLKNLLFGERNKKFRRFTSEISTEKIYHKDELDSLAYDKIISGSDQVWNFNCSGGDDTYLLPNTIKAKKYSYAASFGLSRIPDVQVEKFKENLSRFRYISVREKTGQDICREQLGLASEVVLDPTLLLTKSEWESKLNIRKTKKKYVLVYAFELNDTIRQTAKLIAKQYDLPIYTVPTRFKDSFEKTMRNAGPKEWVELFYNAAFVVTDSFHGTAFSINFNKPFYSFAKNERASRIVDLLNLLKINERLISDASEVCSESEIDYVRVNELLDVEREQSISFIEKIIND